MEYISTFLHYIVFFSIDPFAMFIGNVHVYFLLGIFYLLL